MRKIQILTRRKDRMVDIPENFGDLKRPALQKLCKRLGLKANGKNVDMISAIRDYKSQASLSSDGTHAEMPPTGINDFEKRMHSPQDNEQVAKKGRKRKQRSRRNTSLQSQNCNEETSTTSVPALNVDSPQEFVTPTSESEVMKGVSVGKLNDIDVISTCPSPLTCQISRKRKRRGTHSISPPPKQLIPVTEPSPLPVSKEANSHEPTLAAMEVQPPISPPESTGRLSNRKRQATFSISPPSSSRGPVAPNVDINSASSQLQPPSPKRSRQSTVEISPEADDMKSDSGQKPSGLVGECVDQDSSVKTEILTLLHQRVDDRKADPSYKPVCTTEPKTSRIPVKSATARKFERAHERQFTNMTSIVDHQRRKERREAERKSSGVPAKKPRMHVGEAPVPSRLPKVRTNVSGPFKPTVLSTKNVTFNFRRSPATCKRHGTAEVRKVPKTPNKPFVFSGVATPKSNQGKTTTYKPHTGTLPRFNFSLY